MYMFSFVRICARAHVRVCVRACVLCVFCVRARARVREHANRVSQNFPRINMHIFKLTRTVQVSTRRTRSLNLF